MSAVKWPKTYGRYKLADSSDVHALYVYQEGGFAFYQGLRIDLCHARNDRNLTIVQVRHLSGNGWGSKCKKDEPTTYNWLAMRTDYFASFDALFAYWKGDTKARPMSNRQIEAFRKRIPNAPTTQAIYA
jgi:hypothetical protein